MTPGISNPRTWHYASLALAAEIAARDARHQRQQAADFLASISPEHVHTRREASRVLAHATAQHLDLRQLARLADLHEQYPVLAEAVAALEAGGRIKVVSPPRMQRVSGPPGPTRSRLLNRVLVLLGKLRPAASDAPAFARKSTPDLPLFAAE